MAAPPWLNEYQSTQRYATKWLRVPNRLTIYATRRLHIAMTQTQTQAQTQTDRIEKKILLHATRSRVFRALANAEEFGRWFRVRLDGDFAPGATIRGHITYPGYEHLKVEMFVEHIEPERRFSYRWHPYAVNPDVDYSAEPTTLVEFTLEDAADGTLLRVVESGFDKLPPSRRAEAFRMNDRGWGEQLGNIERHVATG